MNDLARFDYAGTQIRTVMVDGEPWFVAADVARILGYRDAANMTRRLDDEDRGTRSVSTRSGQQDVTVISEPGLYSAILGSQLESAKAFKRWVVTEVLPAIRKTGSYGQRFEIPATYAEALELAARQTRELEASQAKVAELEPAANSWNVLASGDGDWDVAGAAKILSRDPAIQLGRDRLFTRLRELGWIYRVDGRWAPYQSQIDRGRLSVKPSSHYHPRTGELVLDPPQVRVTAKGVQELHRLLGGAQLLPISA